MGVCECVYGKKFCIDGLVARCAKVADCRIPESVRPVVMGFGLY